MTNQNRERTYTVEFTVEPTSEHFAATMFRQFLLDTMASEGFDGVTTPKETRYGDLTEPFYVTHDHDAEAFVTVGPDVDPDFAGMPAVLVPHKLAGHGPEVQLNFVDGSSLNVHVGDVQRFPLEETWSGSPCPCPDDATGERVSAYDEECQANRGVQAAAYKLIRKGPAPSRSTNGTPDRMREVIELANGIRQSLSDIPDDCRMPVDVGNAVEVAEESARRSKSAMEDALAALLHAINEVTNHE